MKTTLLFLMLCSFASFGQGTKKLSQLPQSGDTTNNHKRWVVSTFQNDDGSWHDSLIQVSQSISAPIIDTVVIIIDSGLSTKMNALTIFDRPHGLTMFPNVYYRISDTQGTLSGINALVFPTTPLDKTLIGVKLVYHTTGHYVVIQTPSGAYINKHGGNTSDTIFYQNQAFVYQYKAADSTWTLVWSDAGQSANKTLQQTTTAGDSTTNPIVLLSQLNKVWNQTNGFSALMGLDANGGGRWAIRDSNFIPYGLIGASVNQSNMAANFHVASGQFPTGKQVGMFVLCDTTGSSRLWLYGRNNGGNNFLNLDTAGIEYHYNGNVNRLVWATPASSHIQTIPNKAGNLQFGDVITSTQSLSGASTMTITHGLGYTPITVSISPNSASAAASLGYVSAFNSSTITITFPAPVTGSVAYTITCAP